MSKIVSVEWLNQNLDIQNLIILDASLKSTSNRQTLDINQKTIPHSRYFDIKNSNFKKGHPSVYILSIL